MKAILKGTYYQLKNFFRVKKALFFSFIFPTFLYVIFTFVWGNNSESYSKYILTGILGITIVSNAIMSLGRILVEYNRTGLAKLLKSIPHGYSTHLLCLFLSRFVLISIAFLVLVAVTSILSKVTLTIYDICWAEFGIFLGLFLFSLLGFIVSNLLEDRFSDNAVSNIIFYPIIFLSDAFYPLTEMNQTLNFAVVLNPLTPILRLIRQEDEWLLPTIIWIGGLLIVYTLICKRLKQMR